MSKDSRSFEKPSAACEGSKGFVGLGIVETTCEQWLLNPCWLMISSGIVLPFIYWGLQ